MHPFYKIMFTVIGILVVIFYGRIIIKGNKERKKPIETHTASVEKEFPNRNYSESSHIIHFIMRYDETFHKVSISAGVGTDLFYALPDGVVGQLTHQGRIFHKFEYGDTVLEWERTHYVLRKKE
ncbi:MAG: hypothetical protein LBP62_01135 [Clostridiales bacterium]|jgi:hypothetical protein|nr:hypothetical protein [Clostridiales bacterium]